MCKLHRLIIKFKDTKEKYSRRCDTFELTRKHELLTPLAVRIGLAFNFGIKVYEQEKYIQCLTKVGKRRMLLFHSTALSVN